MKVSVFLSVLLSRLILIQATEIDEYYCDVESMEMEQVEKITLLSESKTQLLEIIKLDQCESIPLKDYPRSIVNPIILADDPDGMKRYPLHVAIMNKSFKCIQLFLFSNFKGFEAKDLLEHEDYFGNKAIDYALKYFPLVSTKCLTHRMYKDDEFIRKIINAAMYENPSLHLELFIALTLRSKKPLETFLLVIREFIKSNDSNSTIYKVFLEDYFEQILAYPILDEDKSLDKIPRNILEKEPITIKVYKELASLAIDRQCYSFLGSRTLFKHLKLNSNDLSHFEDLITEAKECKDPIMMKLVLNFVDIKNESIFFNNYLKRNFYQKKIDSNDSDDDQNDLDLNNADLVKDTVFWPFLPMAFDLKFILEDMVVIDATDGGNQLFKNVMNVLMKDTAFEDLSDPEKTDYLSLLPRFILDSLPVNFLIALHNPAALNHFPETRKLDLMKNPIYRDETQIVIPTVLDLIACFAPKVFPYNWTESDNNYIPNAIEFVFSDDCRVASSVKAEFLRHNHVDSFKNVAINNESTWILFRAHFFDKNTQDLINFIDLLLKTRNNELIYRIASSGNIKLPINRIYLILQTVVITINAKQIEAGKNLSKEQIRKNFSEVFSAVKYIFKFFELGFTVDKNNFKLQKLHKKLLELLNLNNEEELGKIVRVIILRLWQLDPELVNTGTEKELSVFEHLLAINSEPAADLLHSLCKIDGLKLNENDYDFADSMMKKNNQDDKLSKRYKFYRDFAEDKLQQKENS